MARETVGDVAIGVHADISGLQRGLRRGASDMDTFGKRAGRMASSVAKAGAAIGVALAAGAAAGYGLVKSAAAAGAEIERLSTIAGLAPERFQRMAAAAKTVGIEQDKMADILKDVQDRVGDFLQTGGGPMADFFENIAPQIGVTAEQFKKLNSADALQLYVTSLQRAGLSQNEMTFYMEAMSSDLTALVPLLRDGGAEMQRLGDEAAAAGAVLSNDAVKGSQELLQEFENLENGIRNKLIEAILENKDEIHALADDITEVWIPALLKVAEVITTVVSSIGDAINAYQRFRDVMKGDEGFYSQMPATPSPGDRSRINNETREFNRGQGDPSSTGQWDQDFINSIPMSDSIQGSDGADMLGFLPTQDAMASEQERLATHLEALRGVLSEGIGQRLDLLASGYAEEQALSEDHAERQMELEELMRQARLVAVQGALGDVASLMSSNNEKIFKIGKAAALAEATVSGYRAAATAWQTGMSAGGPPVAAAFTAASLARTGSLISGIASQQIGGGSGGGASAGGGAGAAVAAQQAPLDVRISGVNPTDLFTGEVIESLFVMVNEQAGDRGVGRVTFA